MQRAGTLLTALRTEWVEGALGVSRAAVANWRGGKFPANRQAEIVDAVRALLPEHQPEEAPAWARALTDEVLTRIEAVSGEGRMLERLEVLLAPLLPPSSAAADAGASEPPGGGRGRRRRDGMRGTR